jgi:hypothetical protein
MPPVPKNIFLNLQILREKEYVTAKIHIAQSYLSAGREANPKPQVHM